MKALRRVVRLALLLGHVFWGLLLTVIFAEVLRMTVAQSFYRGLVRAWLRRVTRIVGVKVRVYGIPEDTATLLVANHITWLDIPLLGGEMPIRFLSKQEVRGWPVVGWLAAKAGTLFISRGKAGAAAAATATMTEALQSGAAVLLFPEGTTTTGDNVQPFHARLFASAINLDIQVQPIVLRYPGANGLTHPLIPYVDDQALWGNLWGILGEAKCAAEIHFLSPIKTIGLDRKALAALSEANIRQLIENPR
ncbi:lysophospholipid acyltransferase family protein [Candidatus Thiothrix anitrata]|jgi:1-acyl-sn-glycerol-3-phosphate acyltransferase|uniref:1-acyl-sn-glycerol-3-phosphate acyltransferase n=1 Tax=Candidatus Thiothrix anitrata TaxID=2823902 RepID=A0ABX7WZY9_9GAMM|nr:lysophospholipid acyltransferase family protein [Candidatus Thiothrix anitrata]QTR49234.1 1-acyl-sn-glycerol-3-phosphate acyltransferase [Candidatus Thiothrix anitrata]